MAGFTQAQLDDLKAAYARGVRVVQTDGHRVEYQSMQEMSAAIARMERALNPRRSRIVSPSYDRGTG